MKAPIKADLKVWREPMPIYEARIKLAGTGNVQQKVTVQADDNAKAKLLLEAQYGKGSVMTVPVKKG